MLLIDRDSKPQDTIFYISALVLNKIKELKRIEIALLDNIFYAINPKHPMYKYQLALNFLFLADKVYLDNGEIVYVP